MRSTPRYPPTKSCAPRWPTPPKLLRCRTRAFLHFWVVLERLDSTSGFLSRYRSGQCCCDWTEAGRVWDEIRRSAKLSRLLRNAVGLTPAQRSIRASLAAHVSWTRTSDRAARTAPARDAALRRFAQEVDPDEKLDEQTRREHADTARREHFQRMALLSSRSRRKGPPATRRTTEDSTGTRAPHLIIREHIDAATAHRNISQNLGTTWRRAAACHLRPDLDWHSEQPDEMNMCRTVCATCPVAGECLQVAEASCDPWGIWGGLDSHQREQVLGYEPIILPSHATNSRYAKHRCRCALCRKAHAVYEHGRRQRRKTETLLGREAV
jgi:transcription factor WhiB